MQLSLNDAMGSMGAVDSRLAQRVAHVVTGMRGSTFVLLKTDKLQSGQTLAFGLRVAGDNAQPVCGGASMIGNLRTSLFAVAILSIFGLMFAGLAHADGTDPNVTISRISDPSCTSSSGISENDPLIITDASGVTDYCYGGSATDSFYVEVIPYTGESDTYFLSESWTCTPGAAQTCATVSPCTYLGVGTDDCPTPELPAVEFGFFGPAGADFITPGTELQITTPEPKTLGLLLLGLASVAWFGFKRRAPALI